MDIDRALVASKIADFGGLHTNSDPHDLKPGETVEQVNCAAGTPGTLRTRSGLRYCDFSNTNDSSGSDTIAVYPFVSSIGSLILYQRADGVIAYGKNPA